MKYGDLNLKAIRQKANLDFAHFTYQRGMCSCCYGPKDLPKIYWKDGVIPEHDNYSYILFKNADNGRGTVTKSDEITNGTCINWGNISDEQLDIVCNELLAQCSPEFVIAKPLSNSFCIKLILSCVAEEFFSNERNAEYVMIGTIK